MDGSGFPESVHLSRKTVRMCRGWPVERACCIELPNVLFVPLRRDNIVYRRHCAAGNVCL